MSIAESKIKEFVKASKKVFNLCRVENKLGIAFFASDQNLRYPWIYIRDFSCITNGFSKLGDFKTAKKCCDFLLNIQAKDGQWFQKYDDLGRRKDIEKEKSIIQEDNTPLALWAILSYIYESGDKKFKDENKEKIEKSLSWIETYHRKSLEKIGLVYSTTSIHQTPGFNQGYEIWHNSLIVKVFSLAGKIYNNNHYKKLSDYIKKNIGEKLIIDNRFIRKLDDSQKPDLAPDIIIISSAHFDIFKQKDLINKELNFSKTIKHSLKYLEEKLFDKEMGGFFRYPNEIIKKWNPKDNWKINDPLVPGPYFITTNFVIQLYWQLREKNKANKLLNWMLNQSAEGQIAEHLTSRKRFFIYREKEWKYMLKHKKDKKYLEGVKKNFDNLEKEAKKSEILHYVIPFPWAQMETLKCLKAGKYINKFIL
jgi:GH15 family glucan-1,4-alpha-glucosidase